MTTVYVVVGGAYSSKWVAGVYDSVESAIAAHDTPEAEWSYHERGDWKSWDNNLDWDAGFSIDAFELKSETPGADLLERIRALTREQDDPAAISTKAPRP